MSKHETQTEISQTQGNFLNDAMEEIEKSIEIIYDGGKIKW